MAAAYGLLLALAVASAAAQSLVAQQGLDPSMLPAPAELRFTRKGQAKQVREYGAPEDKTATSIKTKLGRESPCRARARAGGSWRHCAHWGTGVHRVPKGPQALAPVKLAMGARRLFAASTGGYSGRRGSGHRLAPQQRATAVLRAARATEADGFRFASHVPTATFPLALRRDPEEVEEVHLPHQPDLLHPRQERDQGDSALQKGG